MKGKLFILMAIPLSAAAGTAAAGVSFGLNDPQRAGSWRAIEIVTSQSGAITPADSTLTAPTATDFAHPSTVPSFNTAPNIDLDTLFADPLPRTDSNRQRAQWSRIAPPTGLPTTTGPLERPGMPDAQGGEDWTGPVGVLFAADTIRPASGFARFIPAPGTAPAWLCGIIMCARRRRDPRQPH